VSTIVYRQLQFHEAPLLGTIDRSERVEAIYRVQQGVLALERTQEEVHGWDASELAAYIARLESVIHAGGYGCAAWDEQKVVGVGSLDPAPVGGDRAVMRLDLLYVSAGYRGGGIGRRLTEMLARHARTRGASRLYISATPSRNTVDAYLRMGARVLESPDPSMLAREPEDIHLVLRVA
jgi:predicted N-acetyltransferase YhbS